LRKSKALAHYRAAWQGQALLLHPAGEMGILLTRGWTGAYQEHQTQTDLKYHEPCSVSKALTRCLIFLACYNLFITAFGL